MAKTRVKGFGQALLQNQAAELAAERERRLMRQEQNASRRQALQMLLQAGVQGLGQVSDVYGNLRKQALQEAQLAAPGMVGLSEEELYGKEGKGLEALSDAVPEVDAPSSKNIKEIGKNLPAYIRGGKGAFAAERAFEENFPKMPNIDLPSLEDVFGTTGEASRFSPFVSKQAMKGMIADAAYDQAMKRAQMAKWAQSNAAGKKVNRKALVSFAASQGKDVTPDLIQDAASKMQTPITMEEAEGIKFEAEQMLKESANEKDDTIRKKRQLDLFLPGAIAEYLDAHDQDYEVAYRTANNIPAGEDLSAEQIIALREFKEEKIKSWEPTGTEDLSKEVKKQIKAKARIEGEKLLGQRAKFDRSELESRLTRIYKEYENSAQSIAMANEGPDEKGRDGVTRLSADIVNKYGNEMRASGMSEKEIKAEADGIARGIKVRAPSLKPSMMQSLNSDLVAGDKVNQIIQYGIENANDIQWDILTETADLLANLEGQQSVSSSLSGNLSASDSLGGGAGIGLGPVNVGGNINQAEGTGVGAQQVKNLNQSVESVQNVLREALRRKDLTPQTRTYLTLLERSAFRIGKALTGEGRFSNMDATIILPRAIPGATDRESVLEGMRVLREELVRGNETVLNTWKSQSYYVPETSYLKSKRGYFKTETSEGEIWGDDGVSWNPAAKQGFLKDSVKSSIRGEAKGDPGLIDDKVLQNNAADFIMKVVSGEGLDEEDDKLLKNKKFREYLKSRFSGKVPALDVILKKAGEKSGNTDVSESLSGDEVFLTQGFSKNVEENLERITGGGAVLKKIKANRAYRTTNDAKKFKANARKAALDAKNLNLQQPGVAATDIYYSQLQDYVAKTLDREKADRISILQENLRAGNIPTAEEFNEEISEIFGFYDSGDSEEVYDIIRGYLASEWLSRARSGDKFFNGVIFKADPSLLPGSSLAAKERNTESEIAKEENRIDLQPATKISLAEKKILKQMLPYIYDRGDLIRDVYGSGDSGVRNKVRKDDKLPPVGPGTGKPFVEPMDIQRGPGMAMQTPSRRSLLRDQLRKGFA